MTRRSISVPVGILAALVLATNVSADPPAWTPAETVRSVNDIEFGDADFRATTSRSSGMSPTVHGDWASPPAITMGPALTSGPSSSVAHASRPWISVAAHDRS